MEISEIIHTTLEIMFGNQPKKALKEFINIALDRGEYFDGFEIAISKNDLDYQEYDDLYDSFKKAYKENIPELEMIQEIIEKELPQSYFTKTSWLVSSLGEIYATDGLRVAKIFDNRLIWVTKRISWDGIELTELKHKELHGKWYSPVNDYSPWSDLVLSVQDGSLLKGELIEH